MHNVNDKKGLKMFMNLNVNICYQWCPDDKTPSTCPAFAYLDKQQKVLYSFWGRTNNDNSELDIEKSYRLKINNDSIADNFINVYKEACAICERCQKEEKTK